MTRGPARWLLPAALGASALTWLAAAELPAPARVVTVVLIGLLPPVLMLQAAIPQDQLTGLKPLGIYVSSLVLICTLGMLAWWGGTASGFTRAAMGLVGLDPVATLCWTGGIVLFAIGVLALGRALRWRETPMLELLLPRTMKERAVFVLLSVAAGIFEELAFRGFLIPALRVATGSTVMALTLSSLAFGMMHGYQSLTGALRASALGAVLAVPLLATGSLVPSMLAHMLYDMIAGLLLADWALRRPHRH